MPYVSLNITEADAVDRVISEVKPDVIVHCAAWTAVDAAEDEENRPKVMAINVDGTRNIARAARKADAKMVYISTDYVFDGQGTEPWEPDCRDYAPLNVYGKSKLGGELAVSEILEKYFIVRIAWVFGLNGKNFIRTMLNVGRTHPEVRVVNDQIGTPTYTLDLARLLVDMIETRGPDTIMPQMRADIFRGMILQKRYTDRQACRPGLHRLPLRSTDFRRRRGPLTAAWTKQSLLRMAFGRFRTGRMLCIVFWLRSVRSADAG